MSYLYVLPDGSYGDARGLIIADISEWTEDELCEFDDKSDSGRYETVLSITKNHETVTYVGRRNSAGEAHRV